MYIVTLMWGVNAMNTENRFNVFINNKYLRKMKIKSMIIDIFFISIITYPIALYLQENYNYFYIRNWPFIRPFLFALVLTCREIFNFSLGRKILQLKVIDIVTFNKPTKIILFIRGVLLSILVLIDMFIVVILDNPVTLTDRITNTTEVGHDFIDKIRQLNQTDDIDT